MHPPVLTRKNSLATLAIILVLAGSLGLVLSGQHRVVETTVTTSTKQSLESECAFVTTCAVLGPTGLELILSVNVTDVKPNNTLGIRVTELNTAQTTYTTSSSSDWKLPILGWFCGCACGDPGYLPHGIELFKGYYTLNNVTFAHPFTTFWGSIPCPVGTIWTGGNVTAYAFQPNSDTASYFVGQKQYAPAGMSFGINVFAGKVDLAPISQISSSPGTYTLVSGDEWGKLVLLHFSVNSN